MEMRKTEKQLNRVNTLHTATIANLPCTRVWVCLMWVKQNRTYKIKERSSRRQNKRNDKLTSKGCILRVLADFKFFLFRRWFVVCKTPCCYDNSIYDSACDWRTCDWWKWFIIIWLKAICSFVRCRHRHRHHCRRRRRHCYCHFSGRNSSYTAKQIRHNHIACEPNA